MKSVLGEGKVTSLEGFLYGSDSKDSARNAGDLGSIPGWDPLEKEMAIHSSILA